MAKKLSEGSFHRLPTDLKNALRSSSGVKAAWDDLTPLARNEFICFVTIAKKSETREKRIRRACEDLRSGKRRPCCWPGCPHRNPNTKKWFK